MRKTVMQPRYAFSVAAKRLAAGWAYQFANGKAALPEALTLFLTHRCNLQCKMCGQWGEGGVTRKQSSAFIKEELDKERMHRLIDDVASFKPNITLFGGEPLLYPECPELVKYIKQRGMHVLMITNGSMLENAAEQLVESGLDELNVSLDGARELHDQIRGLPGLFDRIIAGLRKVRDMRTAGKKKKPLINLQCTISKFNYTRLEELVAVAEEVRADSLTFHNLIFLNRDILDKQRQFDQRMGCSSQDWEGFAFEPGIDPGVLWEKMRQIRSGKHAFAVDFYPNLSLNALKDYYLNPCFAPKEYSCRCQSPWIAAYVFPDGELRPCLNFTYSFGNVKEQSFAQLWNSARAVEFRQFLKESRIFPVCIRCTELYRY